MTTTTATSAAEELAATYKQWMFGAERRRPLMAQNTFREGSDRNYNLKNQKTHDFLQWEHQTFGINLGWTDDASATTAQRVSRWFFARPGGGTGQIKYGETIAMGYGKKPSFIHYEGRTVGINLSWSDEPVFEWKLLGKPAGTPVECGDRLAIYNLRAGSDTVPGVLIYFDRTVGGDIGWPDSRTWTDQIQDRIVGIAEDQLKKLVLKSLGLG